MAAFDLDADRHVFALSRSLRAGSYRPRRPSLHLIRDPKLRLIAAPAIRDRIVHHALVAELAPTFERSFVDQHHAWGTGRGTHRAVLRALASTRRFGFRLSLDIRRYFLSIRHEVLLGLLDRRIRDSRTRDLLTLLVREGGRVYRDPLAVEALGLRADPVLPGTGMAIGSYLSQWSGALYLDGLDHLVLRTLGVGAYSRFMDDLTLFDDDRGHLVAARGAIAAWLAEQRGLALNRKRWHVRGTDEPWTYLGYRISRAGLCPGRRIRRRMAARVREAAGKGPAALARTLASYWGCVLFG